MVIVAGHITVEPQQRKSYPRGLCVHRRTGSPGGWLPRRRDLRGPGRPRPSRCPFRGTTSPTCGPCSGRRQS